MEHITEFGFKISLNLFNSIYLFYLSINKREKPIIYRADMRLHCNFSLKAQFER